MLEKHSEVFYKRECPLHLDQIDDEIIQNHDLTHSPLTVGINGVENSTEEVIKQSAIFSSNRKRNSSGWLKRLLVGVSILIGAGALATGGYYCYTLRGAITRQLSESPVLSSPENGQPVVDDSVSSSSAIRIYNQQVVANSTRIGGKAHSPYSYYENDKNVTSIISDDYPLDNKLKKQLQLFCFSLVKDNFISPESGKIKSECAMLKKIVEKIYYFKNLDLDLRHINSNRELLSVDERYDEIFIRRKLTTLYLAAETIISGKGISRFYIDALKDNKNYTLEELSKREETIINYFSALKPTDAC